MLSCRYSPAVVAEGMVLVAKIGATVAAATGAPVLNIVFCRGGKVVCQETMIGIFRHLGTEMALPPDLMLYRGAGVDGLPLLV